MIFGQTKPLYEMGREELITKFRGLKKEAGDASFLKIMGMGAAAVGAIALLSGVAVSGAPVAASTAAFALAGAEFGLGASLAGIFAGSIGALREKFAKDKLGEMEVAVPGIRTAAAGKPFQVGQLVAKILHGRTEKVQVIFSVDGGKFTATPPNEVRKVPRPTPTPTLGM